MIFPVRRRAYDNVGKSQIMGSDIMQTIDFLDGPMRLKVDATDILRGIFRVEIEMSLTRSGALALAYPEWLPPYHAPRGPIEFVAGLGFAADETVLTWKRDADDMYILHLEVPKGAKHLNVRFDFLTPTTSRQGRILVSEDLIRLQWGSMVFYPASIPARDIDVEASARFPAGWSHASALAIENTNYGTVLYATVNLITLVDSPVLAGRNARSISVGDHIELCIMSDEEHMLPASNAQIEPVRKMIAEADILFGGRPFRRYVFLLALSDVIGRMGLEHLASSENGVRSTFFSDWEHSITEHDLLPHEYVHSWNGKYRIPQGNLTPDFGTPMHNDLMWVFEGLTQYYGHVLAARSGLISLSETLDAIALIAATYDSRPGRSWRPLGDTVNDPIMAARAPQPWKEWQRSEDYYGEGFLIWLEADMLIRENSEGLRSLDDFALHFFQPEGPGAPPKPYGLDEVLTTLVAVQAHDWAEFFNQRVAHIADNAPLGGIAAGGHELVWKYTPSDWLRCDQHHNGFIDLSFSVGLKIASGGKIIAVKWASAAFDAGLILGATIVGVNGRQFSNRTLLTAIDEAADGGAPLTLTVKQRNRTRTVKIAWSGGQRYPHLKRLKGIPDNLSAALKPRTV